MAGTNKMCLSDDEEDLEALRLAALQTLKKNATSGQALPSSQKSSALVPRNEAEPSFRFGNRTHGNFPNKRGRFYVGRGAKNRNEQHYAEQMSMITTGGGDVHIPLHNSAFFERGPQLRAIKAYCSLPEHIREMSNIKMFREETIKYLQDKCFYEFNKW